MLEVKNLVKSYSTKGGVTVKALDDVSVKFPETGMVFLLGRSGSGKSTLLNVAGGLDRPDSGEIIVKGRSSKDFSAADFDSYRNTFVGFVFQEYNILNEFTIEQNIALALQLQSKPNDKKAVAELLEKVDLKDMGKRKPNTLSGGQKQRVAIARALIKEPEIIMADEPTGALDSTTGKQVLDTLKNLSKTKLVIVVSHDREFAEFYGDRIIELKDGQIISDVSKTFSHPEQVTDNVKVVSSDTISITDTRNITESDVKKIVSLLKMNGGEAIISANQSEMRGIKRACKINDSGNKEYFKETEAREIVSTEYDGTQTKFIKSRLPMSRAIKMGASGLKTKPIRLIFTILLAVVAFILFGVLSTFMLYDADYSIANAMQQAQYHSLVVSKNNKVVERSLKVYNDGREEVDYEYERTMSTRFGEQELKDRNSKGNGDYAGIMTLRNDSYSSYGSGIGTMMLVEGSNSTPIVSNEDYYAANRIIGFSDCGEDYLTRNHFVKLRGTYPAAANQIAIPKYLAEVIINTNNVNIQGVENVVGKTIKFSGIDAIESNDSFIISAVYDVGTIPAKFDELKTEMSDKKKEDLRDSLQDYLYNSYNTLVFVSKDFYDAYKDNIRDYSGASSINYEYYMGVRIDYYERQDAVEEYEGTNALTESSLERYGDKIKFYNLNGESVTVNKNNLSESKIYISKYTYDNQIGNAYSSYGWTIKNYRNYDQAAAAELADDSDFYEALQNYYDNSNALEIIKTAVNKWYPKLIKRGYYMAFANYATNTSIDDTQWIPVVDKYFEGQDGELTAFKTLLSQITEKTYEISTVTDADWAKLEGYITQFEQNPLFEKCKYKAYFDVFNSGAQNFNSIIEEKAKEYGYEYAGDLIQRGDEAQIKEAVSQAIRATMNCEAGDEEMFLPQVSFSNFTYATYTGMRGTLEVVGYFASGSDNYGEGYVLSKTFFDKYAKPSESDYMFYNVTDTLGYTEPADAKYNLVITLTNNTMEEINAALEGEGTVVFGLTNAVYSELGLFIEMIGDMSKIFLIAGLVLGVFAALMLLNFISVSISAKKKDIGILRAVGARGSDVFKIFFAEAFIIAIICFVLATAGAFGVCYLFNTSLVEAVSMKLLNFNFINVALIFGISIAVSFIATFFPVFFAARKSPVDSIRAL